MHRDKVLKLAKGFRGRAKNCIRIARERVEKSLQYAYRDRKAKKREMRSLWITRISAGSRQYGVSGSFDMPTKSKSMITGHRPYALCSELMQPCPTFSILTFPAPARPPRATYLSMRPDQVF
jgi:ribosomal protein L20